MGDQVSPRRTSTPLFAAAAERDMKTVAEQQEPEVALRQMTEGHNVVAEYAHVGLTLRAHRLSFLRQELAARRIVTCADAMNARDKSWLCVAGLVLVRQKPRSAKGVMLITIEDETGPANIVVWPSLFEQRRRVVLGASMMAIQGKIQREGDVHLIARQLDDLSSLADRDVEFRNPSGRGDSSLMARQEAGTLGIGQPRPRSETSSFRTSYRYVEDQEQELPGVVRLARHSYLPVAGMGATTTSGMIIGCMSELFLSREFAMPRYLISFDDGAMDHIPPKNWADALEPGVKRDAVLKAMEGHVIAEGEAIGTYERKMVSK